MNRLVWLPAVVLFTVLGLGCQSTKFPSPKWPDIALFKKKDKDLAPPSQHFDVAEQQQLADSSTEERKPTQIPGESTAGTIKPPSDQAKPTAPMVAAKSESSAAPKAPSAASNSASDASSSQPIRKPYELAKSSVDSLNQAASAIASDVERNAAAAQDQINSNANEVVGQFQQQGRDLANAANNSLNQAAANLNQSANNALNLGTPNLGTPATVNSSPATSSPTNSGGAFAFSRPTAAPANSSSLPPWSNPSATANSAPAAPANSPLAPSTPTVDPLKSLAASAALTPSTPSASTSSPPPSPFASKSTPPVERQLQPINQQLVNQNLGAPARDSASSQFQLPVAQPPTFVANRSAAPGNSAFVSTSPTSPPPQGTASGLKTREAPASMTEPAREPAVSGNSSSFPSTGFNAFVAAGSAAPKPNATAADPNYSSSTLQPNAGKINSGWQTQANSVAPASQPAQPSANRPVSYTAELPAELMQRSGNYSPGSVGGDSGSQTLWR